LFGDRIRVERCASPTAKAFGGDSVDAPRRLVEEGPLDYLTLDYLAEVTMSIMQKARQRNPRAGYATDFVELIRDILPTIRKKGIRVVANAGGVNPDGCRDALVALAREKGAKGLRIGTVTGDDILLAWTSWSMPVSPSSTSTTDVRSRTCARTCSGERLHLVVPRAPRRSGGADIVVSAAPPIPASSWRR
jgi:hypothetical protein